MANGSLGLSSAASNFVNAYAMGKQRQAEKAEAGKQTQIKSLAGQMLMGQAQPAQMEELAQVDPQTFLKVQEYQQGQAQAESAASLKQAELNRKEMDDQRADFLDWEDEVFDRVKAADPEARAVVYNQLMRQGRNVFNESFFKGTPEEFTPEVGQFIDSLGDKSSSDLKTGRYKETVAPNGDVYQLDTATGEREFLYKGIEPEVKLLAGMEKRLAETQDNARKASSKSREYEAIANDFETTDVSGGGFSTAWEALKDFTGQQDYESELRRKWMGIKASQVVENLPPGAASDKDIAMAMSGFPPDNASPEIIGSFMRGLSKLEAENAKYNELEAHWIATQGNTAQAKRGFTTAGTEVKKGDTLLDVYKKMSKESFRDMPTDDTRAAVVITAHPQYGDVTEEDIQATIEATGMTRDEVMTRLQGN